MKAQMTMTIDLKELLSRSKEERVAIATTLSNVCLEVDKLYNTFPEVGQDLWCFLAEDVISPLVGIDSDDLTITKEFIEQIPSLVK